MASIDEVNESTSAPIFPLFLLLPSILQMNLQFADIHDCADMFFFLSMLQTRMVLEDFITFATSNTPWMPRVVCKAFQFPSSSLPTWSPWWLWYRAALKGLCPAPARTEVDNDCVTVNESDQPASSGAAGAHVEDGVSKSTFSFALDE